jgi:hypothetical protein
MWAWLKNLFNSLLRVFKQFIAIAIPTAQQILAAEFKDIAVAIVTELATTDLTNEEKRKQAFERIKAKIVESGKEASDSFVNWLVETAYQYFKKTT